MPGTPRRIVARIVLALLSGATCNAPTPAYAHEIPNDVTIHAFVKPEDDRLRLLVRVPLEAMRDMSFPLYGQGYLDIARAGSELRSAATVWIANEVALFEDGRRLTQPALVAARVSIPSDRSFVEYEQALAHTLGPRLPADTALVWQQALLDALLEVPIRSAQSSFSIRPGLEGLGLRVVTVIRFLPPDGSVRTFEIAGDTGLVQLDPRWHQAALRFVRQGFLHILDGTDHLLFLLCLVIPFRRRFRSLVWVVTAFTLAHSVTLAASAYGLAPNALWFPPLIETLIAASIFYMALENIVRPNVHTRSAIAFGFGVIHGFGFSFALRNTLQFAGDHVLTSLLSFNVGVELGQLLVLVLLIPVLNLAFRYAVEERMGTIVLSVLVAHTAWHWLADRFAVLRQFRIGWAELDAAVFGSGLPWLAAGLALAYLAWTWLRRLARRRGAQETAVGTTVRINPFG